MDEQATPNVDETVEETTVPSEEATEAAPATEEAAE